MLCCAGLLDREEFEKALRCLGLRLNLSDYDALFKMTDTDGSGAIDVGEFGGIFSKLAATQVASACSCLLSAYVFKLRAATWHMPGSNRALERFTHMQPQRHSSKRAATCRS